MAAFRLLQRAPSRLASSLLAALVSGALVALFDARSASEAQNVPLAPLLLASAGLILPFALLLGFIVGGALRVLWPDSARLRWRAWLAAADEPAARRQRALALALLPLAFTLWLFIVARWALFALASELSPSDAGVALALGGAALAAVLLLGVQRVTQQGSSAALSLPSPALALVGSGALSLLLLGLAVVSGAPSGSGSFLAMWGVLTRDELDLRPVAEVLLIVASAALVPHWQRRALLAVAALLGVGSLALANHVARHALEAPPIALALERSAPLTARLLPPLRRLFDRDHDGYSSRFGGGDCDDERADVNPGANDVPGNGRDEDCSGADAQPELSAPPPKDVPADVHEAVRAHFAKPLNVVLLTIDTLRYDLGYAGNPRPLSPELDQLARESVVFTRAYSLASYTAKSLPPMLIGRYSSETHRGYSHFNRFEKSDLFLAERLQRAGVHTISVQGHWYFFQNFGMERGFDRLNSSAAPRAAQAAEGDRSVTSERLSDAVLSELAQPELRQKPFFLWAHYTDPHAEYVEHAGIDFGRGARAAYDGEVAFVDREIGRVLRALRQSPLWANTAVVVTSDHGEAFGEHGMIRHGFELWEELVRVPLLWRVPGVEAREVQVRRSAIDVVPTILELMKVDIDSAALSGVSLLPDLVQPPGYRPEPRPIFIDMAEGPYNAERRALIEGERKLVVSGGRPLSLYDLAADPAEKHDLSSDKAALAEMLARYRALKASLKEVTVKPPR